MPGYNENFLSVKVPLPTPTKKLSQSYLKTPKLRKGFYADYINYTVATDKDRRAPVYAALNIDQNLMRKTKRKSTWLIDKRVGEDFQLDNEYYKDRGEIKNPYDKGHLAMRENAGWGATVAEAQDAANDTFFYSNASLQHHNFNADEWLGLEEWVGNLELDLDGKISSFSGPIYGAFSRSVKPPALKPAEVPAGFFKIVFFINKDTKKLDVRAFISMQDQEAIADLKGRKMYNAQNYQTTVREITERTGLKFIPVIAENNPLLYKDTATRRKNYNISHFPERIEVDASDEILSDPKVRRRFDAEDELDVFIAAALVNPEGRDPGKEWISILNLTPSDVDLSDWTLEAWPSYKVKSQRAHKTLRLGDVLSEGSRIVTSGESVAVKPLSPISLSNKGGTIALYDATKRQIDRVKYTEEDAKKPGTPVILFEYQPDSK
jgi:endonuclease G